MKEAQPEAQPHVPLSCTRQFMTTPPDSLILSIVLMSITHTCGDAQCFETNIMGFRYGYPSHVPNGPESIQKAVAHYEVQHALR